MHHFYSVCQIQRPFSLFQHRWGWRRVPVDQLASRDSTSNRWETLGSRSLSSSSEDVSTWKSSWASLWWSHIQTKKKHRALTQGGLAVSGHVWTVGDESDPPALQRSWCATCTAWGRPTGTQRPAPRPPRARLWTGLWTQPLLITSALKSALCLRWGQCRQRSHAWID